MRRLKAVGKPAGILTGNEDEIRRYIGWGYTFVAVGSDVGLLPRRRRAGEEIQELNAHTSVIRNCLSSCPRLSRASTPFASVRKTWMAGTSPHERCGGTMGEFGIGQPVPREEDPYLVRGAGRYVDDVQPAGQARAYVLRSPHGHARIVRDRRGRSARRSPACCWC